MRISDWSSDVCSSDLDERPTAEETDGGGGGAEPGDPGLHRVRQRPEPGGHGADGLRRGRNRGEEVAADVDGRVVDLVPEIGRASCWVSVCQYVSISVVADPFINKSQ